VETGVCSKRTSERILSLGLRSRDPQRGSFLVQDFTRMPEQSAPDPINLHDLAYDSLADLLCRWGYSDYHARQLWHNLYALLLEDLTEARDLRSDLRSKLVSAAYLTPVSSVAEIRSRDQRTLKYLLQLADGQTVETVLMRYPGRSIACLSTQVGCAMGCVFCATGQMGFIRSLSPAEIVVQLLYVARRLQESGETLRNVVFMGMGEPLHNYQATMTALSIMMDDRGLALAPKHITISTVGLPNGIRRLADEGVPVNLAVSLHAANDRLRSSLVPVADRWPLSEVLAACRYYIAKRGRRIFFEWALIAGSNDTPETAHELGRLLQALNAHINLIPLNPTGDFGGRPSHPEDIRNFQSILSGYGLPSTVRQRRGIDIDAGCGQLRARVTT